MAAADAGPPCSSCRTAAMMIDLHLGDSEAELQCFQSALHSIFHGEPWVVIEPHARRAWCVGQFADGATWEDVRDRIRDSLHS